MGRTCGEPDEIGLNAMGVELNGSGRVPSIHSCRIEYLLHYKVAFGAPLATVAP